MASGLDQLDPEHPDSDDGAEDGKTGQGPSRRIGRAIRFRPVHHRIVPVGHDSLLEVASMGRDPWLKVQSTVLIAPDAARSIRLRGTQSRIAASLGARLLDLSRVRGSVGRLGGRH